eukprot:s258_g29.t1
MCTALRVGKAAGALASAGTSWANLGGFVGQAIAGSLLDDGNSTTAMATAAGGWAGGLAGSGVAAAAASSLGIEALGAGSVAGGLVVCGSLSAVGAVAGAGLAFAVKRLLVADKGAQPDRSAEYFDCPLRLLGSADDVFHLFGASLEFPPEDGVVTNGETEETPRLAAAGCPDRLHHYQSKRSAHDTIFEETELPTNRKLHSFGERLPRTFNESMGHVAQERREAYGVHGVHGVPGLAGLGHFPGTAWPPRSLAVQPDDDGLLSNRARTFNGSLPGDRCGSSPVQTPAGTFIATPTWSESGEFATRRDDPCSPLYIQATPQRWASEHCQEMSQPSTGLPSTQAYRGFAGLLARSDPQSFYPEPSL